MLDLARRDYRALSNMLNPDAFAEEIFGFHAQQVVEKALKSWISLWGIVYPYEHDLRLLYQALEDAGERDIAPFRSLVHLSDFAVGFRYSVYDDELLDRQGTLDSVGRVVEHVNQLVGAAEAVPRDVLDNLCARKEATMVSLLSLLLGAAGAAGAAEPFDPATLKPFTAGGMYLDKFEMGLYPGGKNEIPEAHQKAGVRVAGRIKPLNAAGEADEKEGRILAVVFGHSNCSMYFSALQAALREHAAELHPRFELLNAAVGGQQLPQLRQLKGPVWDRAAKLLERPGYSPKQVQVLFLHTTWHGAGNRPGNPPGPFPETMQQMQRDMAVVIEHCLKTYPNLWLAYLTCDGFRHFTNFEPHVWREAFAFKWLIESQLKGDQEVAYEDKPDRPRRLPWLQWGPYIWDNTWDKSYFTDGVHPAPKARDIFVRKYWDFLKSDPVARPWLLKP